MPKRTRTAKPTTSEAVGAVQAAAEWVPADSLVEWEGNPRTNQPVEEVALSILRLGFGAPIVARRANRQIIAGHTRLKAFRFLQAHVRDVTDDFWVPRGDGDGAFVVRDAPGPGLVPVRLVDVTEAEAQALALADNRLGEKALWDDEALARAVQELRDWEFPLDVLGWDMPDVDPDPGPAPVQRPSLLDRFVVPPFSVLDARQGYWQDRKKQWIAIGIRSELGRGRRTTWVSGDRPDDLDDTSRKILAATRTPKPGSRREADRASNLTGAPPLPSWAADMGVENMAPGTSIFDPVLCELAYRWFCPTSGSVLDPFAGGSVRGVVAALLGRNYVGIDLRQEQVDANAAQWAGLQRTGVDAAPRWLCGDSSGIRALVGEERFDMVFSCPPYGDLERYSDDPADLSTMPLADFLDAYRGIIRASVGMLRDDRFAVFVVGDYRDSKGFYSNFVSETIRAFEDAGARLYNEAVLVTAVGSLSIRVGRQFASGRKMGKTHQNVLVFFNGDPAKIKSSFGDVDVTMPDEDPDTEPA